MSWFARWSEQEEAVPETPEALPQAALLSDPGCHRQINEDSARLVRVGLGPHGERGLLLVVADGMGGHEAGEVASQTAVELIEQEYRIARGTPGEALRKAFQRAHQEILQLASRNPAMAGMGTTCTALALVRHQAWAAHVGDSRLYLLRGGGIYQLSEDHTQCMEQVRQGRMTLEEARRHEDRNVLVRAMGTRPELSLMCWPEPLSTRPGDSYVLCSDGLHDLVADDEIRSVVMDSEPSQACRQLVQMAKERGGYDNITVAVARLGEAPTRDQKETREYEGVE